MINLNRLQSLKAQLATRQKSLSNGNRKARTRTLIQMGGLLNLLALPEICGINHGDDLQADLTNQDKAATLLGLLTHLEESLPPTLSAQQLELFKSKGTKRLKNQEAYLK